MKTSATNPGSATTGQFSSLSQLSSADPYYLSPPNSFRQPLQQPYHIKNTTQHRQPKTAAITSRSSMSTLDQQKTPRLEDLNSTVSPNSKRTFKFRDFSSILQQTMPSTQQPISSARLHLATEPIMERAQTSQSYAELLPSHRANNQAISQPIDQAFYFSNQSPNIALQQFQQQRLPNRAIATADKMSSSTMQSSLNKEHRKLSFLKDNNQSNALLLSKSQTNLMTDRTGKFTPHQQQMNPRNSSSKLIPQQKTPVSTQRSDKLLPGTSNDFDNNPSDSELPIASTPALTKLSKVVSRSTMQPSTPNDVVYTGSANQLTSQSTMQTQPNTSQSPQQWWTPQTQKGPFKSLMSPSTSQNSRAQTSNGVSMGSPVQTAWSDRLQSPLSSMPPPTTLGSKVYDQFLKRANFDRKSATKDPLSSTTNGSFFNNSNNNNTFKSMYSTATAFPKNLMKNGQRSGANNSHQLNSSSDSSSDDKSFGSVLESPLSPPLTSKLLLEVSKYKKLQFKEQLSQNTPVKQHSSRNRGSLLAVNSTIDSPASITLLSNSEPATQQKPSSSLSKRNNAFKLTVTTAKATPVHFSSVQEMTTSANPVVQTSANAASRISFRDDVQFSRMTRSEGIKEEEDYDHSQTASPTSPQKLKQIPVTASTRVRTEVLLQKQGLEQIFTESYKNIDVILNENAYFKVPNKIEEDMLSVTVTDKSLLPRKLGILSIGLATQQAKASVGSVSNGRGSLIDISEDEEMEENMDVQIPRNASSNLVAFLRRPSGASFLNIKSTTNLGSEQQVKKKKQKLNLAHLNISSKYAKMIAKALKHSDLSSLHGVDLSYNHIDGQAAHFITMSFPDRIHTIDLSNNSIGPRGTKGLIPLFDSKRYPNLRKLNLENNNITDTGLNQIIPSIFQNMSIYTLNFSHNHLSDSSCGFIKRLLLNSSYIQELYLHWNKFSSFGGLLIAQGLAENLNVKVLDLSHNGLGSIPKLKCGSKMIQSCNVLESAVKHLDMSFNQFSLQECTDIAQALSTNRTLYGVHLEGNKAQGIIDPRGFFVFPKAPVTDDLDFQQNSVQIVTQRIKSVKTKGPNKMQNFDCTALDNCWICHGWQEVRFEIKDGSSDVFTGEPAFLHLDFEDYSPVYMDRDPEDPTRYYLNRMCPPNRKITFFFSDPCKNAIYTSKDYSLQEFQIPDGINLKFETIVHHANGEPQKVNTAPTAAPAKQAKVATKETPSKEIAKKGKKAVGSISKKKVDSKQEKQQVKPPLKAATASAMEAEQKAEEEQEKVMDVLDEGTKVVHKKFSVKYLDGTVISYHAPTFVNYVETGVQRDAIKSGGDYELNVKAIPRQPETFFLISKSNLWHRGISVFRDYIPDSDQLDKKCFEFDWVSSKLPKLLEKGKDIADCKSILRSLYPQLRIAYKYLSCTGIANDVFCITQNPFSNFAQKSMIIDNAMIFVRDIDFNFISASNIALKPKTYRNPDKALIRNEFLEVMGRIAMDKYIRNEKAESNSEALKMFFHEEGLLNHMYEFDSPQDWRKNRYWNQECDEKLKAQLTFLKTLYNLFADSRKNEKRYFTTVKSLSLQEFKDFVMKYDLLDDLLVERDITLSFNLAMMTQVDELNSDRHFQMTFVEFLEAISRLAEKKSMVPLGEIPEEYDLQERVQVKLYYKIESLIASIKKRHELMVLKEGSGGGNASAANQPSSEQAGAAKGGRKSMLSVLTAASTPQASTRNLQGPSKIVESSINFLRALTVKSNNPASGGEGKESTFDEARESNKAHLKNIINKIMSKKGASPSPSPTKRKEKALMNEIKVAEDGKPSN